jgi:hypothetical protein
MALDFKSILMMGRLREWIAGTGSLLHLFDRLYAEVAVVERL